MHFCSLVVISQFPDISSFHIYVTFLCKTQRTVSIDPTTPLPFLAEIGHIGCDWKRLYARCIGGDFFFVAMATTAGVIRECVSVDVTFVLRVEQ